MADKITLDAPETRLERFLAAAAGVDGITLDEPDPRIEKYLYKIAQGGGSGGGVFVVNLSLTNESGELVAISDKTYAEIDTAYKSRQIVLSTVTVSMWVMGDYDSTFSMTGAFFAYLDEDEGNIYSITAQDADLESNYIDVYSIYISAEENEVIYSKWYMNT